MATVKQIRDWQSKRGLRDEYVAGELGITRQWWNHIKNGGEPGKKAAAAIALFLPSEWKENQMRRAIWNLKAQLSKVIASFGGATARFFGSTLGGR